MKAELYVSNNENIIKITFPFDRLTLERVKTLISRRYHPDGKYWTAVINPSNVKSLQNWGFSVDKRLIEKIEKKRPKLKLNPELFPFQKEGVEITEQRNGRILIADEMGLGKTVQALTWIDIHPEKIPVLIIVPASLKLNWAKEAEKWQQNKNIQILSGVTPYEITGDIVIINYDIIKAWKEYLIALSPKILIADEAHFIKNNKADRTSVFKKIARKIPHIIALTGTPVLNRPIEIYNMIKLISPNLFPNKNYFAERYCDAKYTRFGWDASGSTNTEELNEILTGNIMIRRKKQDVLKDLPPKTRSHIPVELNNREEYIEAENDFFSYVSNKTREEITKELFKTMKKYGIDEIDVSIVEKVVDKKTETINILTKIEGLKQLAVEGKMKECVKWIENFLESGEKLVIFCSHKKTVSNLMKRFGEIAVKLDGSTSMKGREQAVTNFQTNPKIKLFIGNIKAAGVGITLTASSNVLFLELPWTPAELDQAEDRCHRIGQYDNVNVYYLLAEQTIEEDIAELLDEKRQVVDAVTDGKTTEKGSLITELIKKMK